MRLTFWLALIGIMLPACGCAGRRAGAGAPLPPAPPAAVIASDSVREALPNDYLRVSFLSAGTAVTTLSRPGALRAFATATPIYAPPLKLADFPYYSGLVNDDKSVLVAMRCRPPHPEAVDAVLATWPNVFTAIQRDVPTQSDACTPEPADTATRMACFAKSFNDPPSTSVPTALAHTFSYAGTLFDSGHTALAQWLKSNYGIYPAFSGTGFSVKDSYSLDTQPMTSQQVLVKSISSEYVLKNVSLADAGCRCISVAPYSGRSSGLLDPNFISQAGGDGSCKSVDRLPTAKQP
jgi:hypothetical protein